MAEKHNVVIIGAGHNGLVTAGYLAKAGLSVLVLERLDKIGGAATTDEFAAGFLGPMCSYGCSSLRGKVIDDLELREHGFEIAYRWDLTNSMRQFHPFPDGNFLGGPGVNDTLSFANQVRGLSEHDARAVFDYQDFMHQASSIFDPYFLTEPPTMGELFESVRGTRNEEVLERVLTWSMVDILGHYFEDERVKASFMYPAETDPSSAGSALGAVIHGCNQFGRDEDKGVPRMSMGAITQAMASSARSRGVEIRTRTPVDHVIVEGGETRGVRLASGEVIEADVVVSNADPKRTFSTLLDPQDVDQATMRRMHTWKTRAGCIKFLAAMSELPDFSSYLGAGYDQNEIVRVKIKPSLAYAQQSWDDCDAGKPTTCPLMDIQLSSVAEPNLVRGRGHVMSNWVLFEPPELAEGTWSDLREEVGEQIIDAINEYAPNFRESLIEWTVQTPTDIETRVGMTDGNIRHLDMIPSQMLSQRQPYRTEVKNFYLCGAGTHPMGEVTGAPGHNAAHAILKDLGRAS